MQIEHLSDKYHKDVFHLAQQFHKLALNKWDEHLDDAVVLQEISTANPENTFLLIVDGKCVGIMYGQVIKSRVSYSKMYQECFLFVDEKHRQNSTGFIKRCEALLRDRGINSIIMSVMENYKSERLNKYYETLGYKKLETHMIKAL